KSTTGPGRVEEKPAAPKIEFKADVERSRYGNFTNTLGETMIFVPSAEFTMGTEAMDAGPNEHPTRQVALTRYYVSRYLITDADYPESSPVGAFPLGASPFGIEDMAGNVWEWCLDFYELYRSGAKTNPRGPTTGTKRVHRGGSWKSRFSSLRTTVRNSNVPGFACNDLGFRIVCQCD